MAPGSSPTPPGRRTCWNAQTGPSPTVDFPTVDDATWESELHIRGDVVGSAPGAVACRGELVWTRLDTARKVFLVSVNDRGDMTAAAAALTAALDSDKADRVVLDHPLPPRRDW